MAVIMSSEHSIIFLFSHDGTKKKTLVIIIRFTVVSYVKCRNIRASELKRQEFKEYFEVLDLEYEGIALAF